MLDDWRFNEASISYNLQLLWFEGKPVVIARPQNQFSGHLRYFKDDPIFISTLEEDVSRLKDGLQEGDVKMMRKRLHIFRFHHKLEEKVEIRPCGRCFAMFLLDAAPCPPAPKRQRFVYPLRELIHAQQG